MKYAQLVSLVGLMTWPAPLFAKAKSPEVNTPCGRVSRSVARGSPAERLDRYLKTTWRIGLEESPELATFMGEKGFNDHWSDLSLAAVQRRQDEAKCELATISKVTRAKLGAEDQINFDLARREAELAVEATKFGREYMPINQLEGLQIDLADTLEGAPKQNARDYDDLLARLAAAPVLIAQTEELMREGLRRGLTPVRMFMERVPAQIAKLIPAREEDGPLFASFKNFPPEVAEADQRRLRETATKLLREEVTPALEHFRSFVANEYAPHCRTDIAWTHMPQGTAWYAYLVRRETTTNLQPAELHELGLREVDRIQKEMDAVRVRSGFKGDQKAFHKFLLSDSRFYYPKPDDLLAGYRDIAKRIDGQLPKLFRRLPQLPYGVQEMPAYKATDAPAAYYMPGSLKGARAGYFAANTYDLKARPKWGMEVLTSHEAVPGHHLQISLAQDLEGLPDFRKNLGPTAFVEGWGLYAEGLGEELGLYQDANSKYGRLIYEKWRAVRLVVDTGMHQLDWSREKAIDYFLDAIPKSRLEAEVEIDRYITWPGQALAYKVGELKFRELRDRARRELGPRFDIREFHEEVLRHGALPLDVLERVFQQWLTAKK